MAVYMHVIQVPPSFFSVDDMTETFLSLVRLFFSEGQSSH